MRLLSLFVSLCLTLAMVLFWNQPATAQNTARSESKGNPSQQTGIDPTDIRTRIETAYTYNERENGVTRHILNNRLEREFAGQSMNVRMDVPLVYSDIPDDPSQKGLGDIGIRFNYRYKNAPGYSALLGGTITFDTAADTALGDNTTKLTGVWVNSWRKEAWLFSGVTLATWSESGEKDAAGIVPAVAYQPMEKYLSYVSVGLPIIRDLDDNETSALAIVRFGKVFHGGNVLYLGTRKDLSGKSDDDLVITMGYRRMF